KWTGARYGSTIHPACYDGAERLKAMDVDGVDAEMLYPPQRAMLTFMKNPDRDAHLAGILQIPNVGIETAVAELERAKKEGFRGVALSAWPSGGDNLRPEDDPFWDAAAELGMPVSIHLLLAAQQQKLGASNKGSVAIGASAFMYTMPILVEMIFQGVFDRFPKLVLALVEVGVGWI